MSKLIVIRHSISLANEQGILMGSKFESPLSKKGIELAKQKAKSLKKQDFIPDLVFTSRLLRAKQTAQIIIEEIGVSPKLTELKELNERDFGIHEGKPYKSILDALDKYGENAPTIEKVDDFIARVLIAYEIIKSKSSGKTLVVTHSNPEMVMHSAATNPNNILKYWELGDPKYCEGFSIEI